MDSLRVHRGTTWGDVHGLLDLLWVMMALMLVVSDE